MTLKIARYALLKCMPGLKALSNRLGEGDTASTTCEILGEKFTCSISRLPDFKGPGYVSRSFSAGVSTPTDVGYIARLSSNFAPLSFKRARA